MDHLTAQSLKFTLSLCAVPPSAAASLVHLRTTTCETLNHLTWES